jgi:tRNA dimethylallyltransferase
MASKRTIALPLLVICGPTASGKTGLAIRLAKEFNGEVISADSRAIYRDLNIGTAKPDLEERQGIPHWGIDIVAPGEPFSAADFKAYALQKIEEIKGRGHIPILVGGTGLYVDGIVFDYTFPERPDAAERVKLETWTLEELHSYCYENNIDLPENAKNKRYVINTILRQDSSPSRRSAPIENCIIVGIATDKDVLQSRIEQRAERLTGAEVRKEAERASAKYGWNNEAMTANIYPLMKRYIEGGMSLNELRRTFIVLDWHLAKRQLTWLRRNEYIKWLSLDEAYTYCARALANLNNS